MRKYFISLKFLLVAALFSLLSVISAQAAPQPYCQNIKSQSTNKLDPEAFILGVPQKYNDGAKITYHYGLITLPKGSSFYGIRSFTIAATASRPVVNVTIRDDFTNLTHPLNVMVLLQAVANHIRYNTPYDSTGYNLWVNDYKLDFTQGRFNDPYNKANQGAKCGQYTFNLIYLDHGGVNGQTVHNLNAYQVTYYIDKNTHKRVYIPKITNWAVSG